MTTISAKYARECFSYNPVTGVLTWKADRPAHHFPTSHGRNTWRGRNAGKVAGSIGNQGYRVVTVGGKFELAHRLIWLMVTGELPKHETDHINGDRLDNRLSNLRAVTTQENQRNAAMQCNNTSGHVGVDWNKASNKWRARIKIDGKQKYLGGFTDIEDAIEARAEADIKYGYHKNHGRPANTLI